MKKILLFIALFLFVSCEDDKEDPITIVGNWGYNKVVYWNTLPCHTGDSTVFVNESPDYAIASFNSDYTFSISNFVYYSSDASSGSPATVEGSYSYDNGQLCLDATMDAGATMGGWNSHCYAYELTTDTLILIKDFVSAFVPLHSEYNDLLVPNANNDSSCQYWYFVRQ